MPGVEFKEGTAALEFEGWSLGSVRVRFKGHSSFRFARESLKRSLKLDFNDIEKGHEFFGLTKLNLNNNAMDPSQIREALAYEVFRSAGVPAGRTAFARVFLTVPGQYNRACAGLYTLVEQVDERFLKSRFGTKHGMLLKPDHLPGLPILGDDWAAYAKQAQAKSSVSADETSLFIEFVRCLNLADDARFRATIADYLDVDEFLRFLAVQGLLANLDSPLVTGHNYYLYLSPKTRKFIWLPWDLNEAFAGFNPAGSIREQTELSVDHPFSRENRLAERLLRIPAIRERYHQIVRLLLENAFCESRLCCLIDAMAATTRPALGGDPMASLPAFEGAMSTADHSDTLVLDNEERIGAPPEIARKENVTPKPRAPLKAFIGQRILSVQSQLEGKTDGYTPRELQPGPAGPRPPSPPIDRSKVFPGNLLPPD